MNTYTVTVDSAGDCMSSIEVQADSFSILDRMLYFFTSEEQKGREPIRRITRVFNEWRDVLVEENK